MAKPFVSVLIDTYNHEKFIEKAITSVLEQDFPASDYEVLVVDDGSTDRTPELVKKFAPRVTYLPKQNGGQASAFNFGIPRCRGEIVTFLDGDDWWEPNKLATVISAFEYHPEIGTIGHGLYEVDESGKRLYSNIPARVYSCRLDTREEALAFAGLLSFLGTSRLAVRRSVLDRVLPVSETLLGDLFLAAVAVAASGAIILDQPLTNYRLHSANVYQFAEYDVVRMRQKLAGFQSFIHSLPRRLAEWNVPAEVAEVLLYATRIDAERLQLALGQGWPWDSVRVERAAMRQAYKDSSFGYRVFHAAVLAVAAVTPPKLFYRLRHWYSARGIARVRDRVGAPVPRDSLVIRKPQGR